MLEHVTSKLNADSYDIYHFYFNCFLLLESRQGIKYLCDYWLIVGDEGIDLGTQSYDDNVADHQIRFVITSANIWYTYCFNSLL